MKKKNDDNKTIGQIIKELRLERKMTQEALAEKVGVTNKSVSKWEQDYSKPDIEMIKNISKVFGVSLSLLIKNEITLKDKIYLLFEKFSKLFNYSIKNAFILIFSIAFIFFLLFYVNNVNTDQIYRLNITSDDILIDDSGLVLNRIKNILYINLLPLRIDYEPKNAVVELYAYVRGEKITLYKGYDLNNIIIDNSNRYPNILSKDVINAMLKNMFLEIKLYDSSGIEHIYNGVISTTRIYSNNRIFYKGKSEEKNNDALSTKALSSTNELAVTNTINQKLIDLGYRYENETYIKEDKDEVVTYDGKDKILKIEKRKNEFTTIYKYYYEKKLITYKESYRNGDNYIMEQYRIGNKEIECLSENCSNNDIIKTIINTYNEIQKTL